MSDHVRDALEGAQAYLRDHPDEARYTDSAVTARLGERLHVTLDGTNGEHLETDMVSGVGGLGEAPGPGWLYRASLASCVTTLAGMRAAELGIEGLTAEVTVDSESDDRGILGLDPSIPAGPLSLRIVIGVSAPDVDVTTLTELASWAVERCPVADATRREIPMAVEVNVE